jgi:hypothetical protein
LLPALRGCLGLKGLFGLNCKPIGHIIPSGKRLQKPVTYLAAIFASPPL